MLGNTVSDGHYQFDLGFNSLNDSLGGEGRRHVDNGGVALGHLFGFSAVFEDRKAQMGASSLFGVDTADHLGSIGQSLFCLKCSLNTKNTSFPVIP